MRRTLAPHLYGKCPHPASPKYDETKNEVERSGILALHRFLNEVDPTGAKLGLHRVPTYTGDYRWLCAQHYAAWQPNIPDVIPHEA